MAQQAVVMKQDQEQDPPVVKPEGGKLSGMADSYRSWRKYQKELPELIAAAEKNLLWLESALIDYRMTLLELSYKQDAVDVEIWDLFTDIRDEVPRLKRETLKTPLYLRNNTHLDALWASWNALLAQEERLLDLISKAPDALRYFNTAQLLRVHLAEEHARRSENVQKISQAREQLERTLVDLDHHTSDFEPISLGSRSCAWMMHRRCGMLSWKSSAPLSSLGRSSRMT